MVRFDELSYAEEMYNTQSFIKSYCVTELTIYAKWLKWKKLKEIGKDYLEVADEENEKIEKSVRDDLIDFATKHYSEFNYTVNYTDIDKAVANTRVAKLLIPKEVKITRNEYNTLMSIENDAYRRVLFIMLVDAKFKRENNVLLKPSSVDNDTPYYVRMERSEIIRLSKAKFEDKEDRNKGVWGYLGKNKFAEMRPSWANMAVRIVDTFGTDDIVEVITDYDHLDLHYERMIGGNIGECKFCGKLFRQNKNRTAEYCFKHRGKIKESTQFRNCIDCGNPIQYIHNKVRCNECENKKIREDTKIRVNKYRNKVM